MYTNVLRLARTINHADERFQPPIPQIVFYQSGIGTENNFYSEYIEGTTGGSLADKVEEAYAFIAHNYNPGDEIFLFGFSRGAYTARMVAMFIGEIGVLDRKDMDHFAKIFLSYQKLGKSKKPAEIEALRDQLEPWCHAKAKGRLRADIDRDTFTVKCIGVFDTVGSVGMPESLTFRSARARNIFGFPDQILGEHVERAYQALALHENRADFNCNKFKQTERGIEKKQVLKQCWFTGAHTDIGGGYKQHDLADLTLTWMAAHVGEFLSLDIDYLAHLIQPVAPWGQQKPHDSRTGIFVFTQSIQRVLPTHTGLPSHEWIHPSVLEQAKLFPALDLLVKQHPELICKLLPLEEEMKVNWPYKPESPVVKTYTSELEDQLKDTRPMSPTTTLRRNASSFGQSILRSLSLSRREVSVKDGKHDLSVTVVKEAETVEVKQDGDTKKLKKLRRRTVQIYSATQS